MSSAVSDDLPHADAEAPAVEQFPAIGVPAVGLDQAGDTDQIDRLEADLAAVDAAMSRLASGEYGACMVCHIPIDDSLLAADPTLATCTAHVHLR